MLPIGVQTAADARPHVGFAEPVVGIAVFDGVQHLEIGLQGGVVGAYAKRRRPADFVVGRGRSQIVATLLTIFAQPEVRLVDGTVLGIAADEVVDRLNVPLRVRLALAAGVQRFRGLEAEIGRVRGVGRPSVRVQHRVELRQRAPVAPLLVQADAEIILRVGLEHRGVRVVRGQHGFEQRHGFGEPAFLHVRLGFQPRRKRKLLFDEGEGFLAVEFGVGQRLGTVLPFAAGLAQFEQQTEQLTAQGAALLAGRVAALFGDGLGLLEPGLRQRVRGGRRAVGAFGVAAGLVQRVLRLAHHLGREARLLEQEFEIADRPVELLELALAQRPAEQALVLEFGGMLPDRELAEPVHGRGQEFVLLLGVLERERADVVEPIQKVERARRHALLAEIRLRVVQGFEVAVLFDDVLGHPVEPPEARLVDGVQRGVQQIVHAAHRAPAGVGLHLASQIRQGDELQRHGAEQLNGLQLGFGVPVAAFEGVGLTARLGGAGREFGYGRRVGRGGEAQGQAQEGDGGSRSANPTFSPPPLPNPLPRGERG